jgi:hypothetical protein
MQYVLFAGIGLLAVGIILTIMRRANPRQVARLMRWLFGGIGALAAGYFLIRGRVEVGLVLGGLAFSILKFGRIGPWTFESETPSVDNVSSVRSRYIAMTLDHDSGEVAGKVIYGEFQGIDLINLGENETRRLLNAVSSDPDSLALLESWLDKNRSGWREWFASHPEPGPGVEIDEDAIAYEVLGLKPGASAEEIRAAHRKLMMGVHPDQGGSNFLASKINEAKDRLLKKVKS